MTLTFHSALNPEPAGLWTDFGLALPDANTAFDQLDSDTKRACMAMTCLAQHLDTPQAAEVLERLNRLVTQAKPHQLATFIDGQFKILEKALLSHWRHALCDCHLNTLGYLAHLKVRVTTNPQHPRLKFRRGVNIARYRGALVPALHQLLINHHQCSCDLCYDVATFMNKIPMKSAKEKTALHKRIAHYIITMHPLLPLEGYEVDRVRDAIRLSQAMIVNTKG